MKTSQVLRYVTIGSVIILGLMGALTVRKVISLDNDLVGKLMRTLFIIFAVSLVSFIVCSLFNKK